MATQKITNFDVFLNAPFLKVAAFYTTAVTIQSNKIVLDEVKANYRKSQMNFFGQSNIILSSLKLNFERSLLELKCFNKMTLTLTTSGPVAG